MKHYPLITTTALLAALTLAACGRDDATQTTGQRVDETRTEAGQNVDAAKAATAEAARDVKDGAGNAMDKAKAVVSDVTITASVNAELAKDPALSALRINVDTVGGKVALRGTAPDAAARDRATQLAAAVEGVVSVDNQLTIAQG
jgi:hyperosmotically inducible protein